MEDHTEKILQELFVLDPALKADESLVRALVAEMLAHKPSIVPDASLKAAVRARLLAAMATSTTETKSGFVLPWWLVYSAPVGVAAVLFLLTAPGYSPAPDLNFAPTTMPEAYKGGAPAIYSESAVDVGAPTNDTGLYQKTTPGAESDAAVRSMTMPEDMGEGIMTEMAEPEAVLSSSLYIGQQQPGMVVSIAEAAFTAPAFVLVRDLTTREVVGVSELYSEGTLYSQVFLIKQPLLAERVYEAAVYLDDGDGVFVEETDTLVFATSFIVEL